MKVSGSLEDHQHFYIINIILLYIYITTNYFAIIALPRLNKVVQLTSLHIVLPCRFWTCSQILWKASCDASLLLFELRPPPRSEWHHLRKKNKTK